ncbi:MAG: T9SS type A sorting domain-containing protein [Flavobacteriales bacterium]|nr:T9SS type A sorting domain-containing protein [Flavobacteriales bacterium]MBK7270482.1 T9SS type A sorting domain-containing protein [Flavobacteriales bacterium]MBK7751491.1 T9SS type A sorting domain-containing protein [Flavobacteriales bacterium]MBK9073834.1 T9SS type A sorting domain-containing protein [Flavobacteriales bacterium]MBK9539946.1 T9SS type A sorting domain-containing protein [Flavobacteriales bacterium]
MCLTSDGGACIVGYSDQGSSQVYMARLGPNGDSLWTQLHGTAQSENAYAVALNSDEGFLVSGSRLQTGNQYDMLLMRTNAAGNLMWQRTYGSPWSDNPGFVSVHPDGGYVMAGGQRAIDNGPLFPTLLRLADDGDTLWTRLYENIDDRVFFAAPIVTWDGGYTVAGTANGPNSVVVGMLAHVDSAGTPVWRRTYQAHGAFPQYFYDVRRTLDGGYIMAGTAVDSMVVSQDAWLVKVDSFGCLVPGCQVFDGLEEQVTDLRDAVVVFPNPASGQATVRITLPEGPKSKNLRLALVTAEGKLVQEDAVASMAPTHVLDVTRCAPGLYFVHLLDGTRWLSGTKVVVE